MKYRNCYKVLGMFVLIGSFIMGVAQAFATESVEEIDTYIETSRIVDCNMRPSISLPYPEHYSNSYCNIKEYDGKPLKNPTQITRQGQLYFIVDCEHDRVLYAERLDMDLSKWKVMTRNNASVESQNLGDPHAIASDGEVYLVTDTAHNRVLVFEKANGNLWNSQYLDNIGDRPHYIRYDESSQSFFVWSSMNGEMYILRRDALSHKVYLQEIRRVEELANDYVRSFTIIGDQILFPSGTNCCILAVDKESFEVTAKYPVPESISGMACIIPIENYFYMTVSSDNLANHTYATMIRTNDLNKLAVGDYEEIYSKLHIEGIPYYIDYIDGMYYMTNHGSKNCILRFSVQENCIDSISVFMKEK